LQVAIGKIHQQQFIVIGGSLGNHLAALLTAKDAPSNTSSS
jgi:hypothetical protein